MKRRELLQVAGATAMGTWLDAGTAHAVDIADVDEVDYIVVGSGPGGTPLASSLALAGHTVLVLEAGPPTSDTTLYDVPAFHQYAAGADKSQRWDYYVQHYSDLAFNATSSQWVEGKGILYPRASTLGGCTAHNAMVTMCPEPSDWAYIQELTGDDSWDPETMWGHWEDLRSWQPLEFYALSDIAAIDPQLGAIIAAARDETGRLPGGAVTDDPQGVNKKHNVYDTNQGFFPAEQATRNGRRIGMRERLNATRALHPDKLLIATDALVERVLFTRSASGRPRAVGVEYLAGRHLYSASPLHRPTSGPGRDLLRRRVRARKEVIIAAGAYNSPQLLMLSGIGPAEHLRAHGIAVVADLPGVGSNLQDRYEVPVVTTHPDFLLLSGCSFGGFADMCLAQWQLQASMPLMGKYTFYGTNGVTAAIKRRIGDDPRAQVYAFGFPSDFRGYSPGFDQRTYVHDKYTWLILKGYAESRQGTVRLRSADPTVAPEVNHRKFDDGAGGDADIAAMIESVNMVRRINAQAGKGSEVWPGPGVASDADLEEWIRREAWGHHASCTNPIGVDPAGGAVLDGKFRVHGVDGLRVVDASSFPRIPGLFIWAPIAIASQKAGRDILDA